MVDLPVLELRLAASTSSTRIMSTRPKHSSIHPSRRAGRFRLRFSVDPDSGSVVSGDGGPQDRSATQGS